MLDQPAMSEYLERAQNWLEQEPDAETRNTLAALIESGDQETLADCFYTSLQFGTAGLRGLIGPGPNRMNRSVVIRATAGLCEWVREQVPDAQDRGICIAFDGRRMSDTFARDAIEVALGAGFRVYAYDQVVPTPVLAHAVLAKHAAAGIMVTASHNPPEYNGYKVYWENGAQIIPPHDHGIADCIAKVDRLDQVTRLSPDANPRFEKLGDTDERAYLEGVQGLLVQRDVPRDLTIAYSAMHGVGNRFVKASLRQAGFERVFSVPEQAEPDGSFPTVAFPNPEEEGAMDLLLALAQKEAADVALANDPDADRLAVAVRDEQGQYVTLNGNEIGCLLAHYLLEAGSNSNVTNAQKRCVISSVVSSPMLGSIARFHDTHFEQTLTGFKWIANRAIELEGERDFVFGYEEALGYTAGTLVRDKDGVSAATLMAEMAAWCKSYGRTLLGEREVMWRRYGMFLSEQVSLVRPGADGLAEIAAKMRAARERLSGSSLGFLRSNDFAGSSKIGSSKHHSSQSPPPVSFGAFPITGWTDYETRERSRDGKVSPFQTPPSNVLLFEIEGGHRVMMRPSGTEPKLKLYHDIQVRIEQGESVVDAHARGSALLGEVVTAFRAWVDAL